MGDPDGTTGERIVFARERRKIKQGQLAARLKISRAMLSYYETGKREIPMELLALIAKVCKTSIESLISEEDKKRMKAEQLPLDIRPAKIPAVVAAGAKLRKLRGATTQSRLAMRAGVPITAIRNYELGTHGITTPVARKIAATLHVPVEDILPKGAEAAPPNVAPAERETQAQRWTRLHNESGMSVTDFAHALCVSTAYVNRIKAGKVDISLRVAAAAKRVLSEALGRPISIEYLWCADDVSAEPAKNVVPIRGGKASAPVSQASAVDARLDRVEASLRDMSRMIETLGLAVAESLGRPVAAAQPHEQSRKQQ